VRADALVFTGDFISSFYREIELAVPALRRLAAPAGAYAVLGNHDFYGARPERLTWNLADAGFRVLRNEHAVLRRGGESIALVGVDDPDEGDADLDRATRGLPPGTFPILACHNPDILPRAARWGFPLVLSGHTHGGQFDLPGLGAPVTQTREPRTCGVFRVDETVLHVTSGLGVIGVPFRYRCPAEAAVVVLRRAASASTCERGTDDRASRVLTRTGALGS
jgi:hypothetical protein